MSDIYDHARGRVHQQMHRDLGATADAVGDVLENGALDLAADPGGTAVSAIAGSHDAVGVETDVLQFVEAQGFTPDNPVPVVGAKLYLVNNAGTLELRVVFHNGHDELIADSS